jgi:hypothetical protein
VLEHRHEVRLGEGVLQTSVKHFGNVHRAFELRRGRSARRGVRQAKNARTYN